MELSFNIKRLEAILSSSLDDDIEKYAKDVDLSHIAPLKRRRLSKSARYVFSCLKDFELRDTPVVFSSKYGEVNRCYALLEELAKNEPISPTSFSLSVHNAISSQHSIFAKNSSEISAISSDNSLEYALLDGYLKLNENHKQVLVISHFEGAMSEFLEEDLTYVLVLLIEKGDDFTLKYLPKDGSFVRVDSSIEFLKNWEKGSKNWEIEDKNSYWQWNVKDD